MTTRVLTKGSRLVGRPCDVFISEEPKDGTVWAWCRTCITEHLINVTLFERGKGPWELIEDSVGPNYNLDAEHYVGCPREFNAEPRGRHDDCTCEGKRIPDRGEQ